MSQWLTRFDATRVVAFASKRALAGSRMRLYSEGAGVHEARL